MKNRIKLTFALLVSGMLAFGQQKETGVVKLRGTRLTYPLVNKWIAEFNKEYPNIKVAITPTAQADSIDFTIASYALTSKELEGNRGGIAVSRYVQLLVVNDKRPDLAMLQNTGITEQNLSNLFFSPTPTLTASTQTPLSLYVRDRPVCAVKAFAGHLGNDPKELRGTGIKGDDQDLAEAVRKDVNGLCFNNLGFIYDAKTRKVTDGLAVVPLDLNENGKVDKEEQIYGTLDQVIDYIEATHNPKFVNERVNFIYNKSSTNISAGIFLNWVLTKGQKFHHDLGFLSLDEKLLADQRTAVASTFKTSSSSCEGADEVIKKRKSKLVNN